MGFLKFDLLGLRALTVTDREKFKVARSTEKQ
jgi:DNA polymerase III alpha subunit